MIFIHTPAVEGAWPGMKMRAIDLVIAFAGSQLFGQLAVFVPGHIVGRIIYTGFVKQGFVVI